ncbi:RNA-directed DNA polymerase, eukaryota, Reverse transcriptase zinc-binding domain protein [Artemisia annua]|uniref:RNA-directed DNA polymerase, eukaryota, Reverse transcriptase zinc-binding domain protein n=1 Tax=Artemisia annua TaxID=35608 RepID=A0A2U1PJK1_ARTAN|nr:RNA-directed DNA polymerase, eukaryota, Reverse transcriptase zinc-binding domain protein [Artemisia annua]
MLWRKVVESIHGGRGKWVFLPNKNALAGCWKTIVSFLDSLTVQGKKISQFVRGKLGNGDIMRFWHDLWFGSVLLKDRWPTLYRLERNKSCSIASRVKRGEDGFLFVGNWSRHPASVEELSEKQDLDRMLLDFCFSDREDSLEWVDSVDGRFSVALCKKLFRLNRDQGRNHNMRWESWVPNKVNLLVWRAEFARIPTRDALIQRRIPILTMSCPLCEVDDENLKNLFIGCGFAYGNCFLILYERLCPDPFGSNYYKMF